MPINKRLRFEIFKRDGFTCQYCGAHPPDAVLEVDHIVPVADGGSNDEENLVTACFSCNRGKAAVSLTSVPKSLADKAAEVQEREEQIAGWAAILEAKRERIERDAWRVAETLHPGASNGYPISRFNSIKRFIERLGVHETLAAAEIAVQRELKYESHMFRYFCGVCWKRIKNESS